MFRLAVILGLGWRNQIDHYLGGNRLTGMDAAIERRTRRGLLTRPVLRVTGSSNGQPPKKKAHSGSASKNYAWISELRRLGFVFGHHRQPGAGHARTCWRRSAVLPWRGGNHGDFGRRASVGEGTQKPSEVAEKLLKCGRNYKQLSEAFGRQLERTIRRGHKAGG